jgi:hypothetical protein
MLDKIKDIITSYAAMVNPTEAQKKAAEIRLATCMTCEEWKENALGIAYCGKCGCATSGKIFTQVGMQACPLMKWEI